MTPSAMPHSAIHETIDAAVRALRTHLPGDAHPRVGLILGSGLGGYADSLKQRVVVPYAKLPGFVSAQVKGHAGNLVYGHGGTPGSIEVLALQGRVHAYEGHDLHTVVHPARVLIEAGCRTLIITNASGGVDPTLEPGEIVLLSDHLNLLGDSPLRGPNDERLGPRFPDMTEAYSRRLRLLAQAAGGELGLILRECVYACMPGPAYETPAEVRMVRTLGGDLVGMSTVPEVLAARHMGAEVLGLSCVANPAAGITGQKLTHQEVTETADRVKGTFAALLDHILGRLAAAEHA